MIYVLIRFINLNYFCVFLFIMARTKQTARKSQAARPRGKQIVTKTNKTSLSPPSKRRYKFKPGVVALR